VLLANVVLPVVTENCEDCLKSSNDVEDENTATTTDNNNRFITLSSAESGHLVKF
jgi:hypothetical protein